ncbi:MAG: hypothetical protein ABFD49_10645 [Armatimonadota bacterium]|nr:hypothetical protein [bacterium]
MLDDYKYSIGRLVVYRHTEPKLPKQSYGHHGSDRTVGEVLDVDIAPTPEPHWVYTLRNVRNQETIKVDEDHIKFATAVGRYWKKTGHKVAERRSEDRALAEMIAKALISPDRARMLSSTLRDLMHRENQALRASEEGVNLPVSAADYVRLRGDLRKESEPVHNHYAKIISVEPSDIAGIENADSKPGQPRLYRTLKKFKVLTTEGIETEVYDAEIKIFYTANGRKTILNWRAATLLAEAFHDEPPYKPEYEYLSEHIFTREELESKSRSELAQMLAAMLYVKGRLGWRDYQRRNQFFAGTPKSHLLDEVLEVSRFDSRRNRFLTLDEIVVRQKDAYRLRRLLKSG